MLIRSVGFVVFSGFLVAASSAASLEEKEFQFNLAPGAETAEILGCTKGGLRSGGYTIDNFLAGTFGLAVRRNSPQGPNTWRVGLMNVSNAHLSGTFSIQILCD